MYNFNNLKSELTSAIMDSNLFSYRYDDIGNRKEASANAVTTTYEANELNQYTEVELVTPVNPTYDADGNLINDGRWEYTWDAENRLVQARYIGRHFDPPTITFEYDYMGRLVHKYYYVSMSVLARRHYVYVYDGWNRIQERNWPKMDNENIKTNVFVWGLDLSGSLQGAGGVGGLLAVSEGQRLAVHYPFYDGNGNITDWMDADGALAAHHEYDPYGNETTGNPPASFGFSTKPLDSTLGLYYYGYRFYSPEIGRFLSRDPLEEEAGSINLFIFVSNAPVDIFDILGLADGDCKTDRVTWNLEGGSFIAAIAFGQDVTFNTQGRVETKRCDKCCPEKGLLQSVEVNYQVRGQLKVDIPIRLPPAFEPFVDIFVAVSGYASGKAKWEYEPCADKYSGTGCITVGGTAGLRIQTAKWLKFVTLYAQGEGHVTCTKLLNAIRLRIHRDVVLVRGSARENCVVEPGLNSRENVVLVGSVYGQKRFGSHRYR